MKHLGLLFSVLIFAFWVTMNVLMIARQHELEKLGYYQKRVNQFLESSHRRERWLGIYKSTSERTEKLGYTGAIVQKLPGVEGTEYHTELETLIDLRAFGEGAKMMSRLIGTGNLEMRGLLVQDAEMKPMTMAVNLYFPSGGHVIIQGRRVDEKFEIRLHNDAFTSPPLNVPLENLDLGNGLFPTLPLAGYKEGETFQIATINPVFLTRQVADVEVVSLAAREVNGVLVDVYTIQIEFKGTKSTSLVTRDGTLLQTKIASPLNLVLRREKSSRVKKGLDR